MWRWPWRHDRRRSRRRCDEEERGTIRARLHEVSEGRRAQRCPRRDRAGLYGEGCRHRSQSSRPPSRRSRTLAPSSSTRLSIPTTSSNRRGALYNIVTYAEFKAQIADYLKTSEPHYPKTLDEIVARANDPKTGYRSPEKAVAHSSTPPRCARPDRPGLLAAKNEALAATKAAMLALFAQHTARRHRVSDVAASGDAASNPTAFRRPPTGRRTSPMRADFPI